MFIKEYSAEPIMQKAFCSACEIELKYSGEALLSSPPKYVHECPRCGEIEHLSEAYPVFTFREVPIDN